MIPPRSDKAFALASTAARSLGRLGLAVGVARGLGAEAFGVYALLLVIETVLTTLVACRAAAPLTTLAPGYTPQRQKALYTWALARQGRDVLRGTGAYLLLFPVAALSLSPSVLLGFGLSLIAACLSQVPRGWRLATFCASRVLAAEILAVLPPLVVCLVRGDLTQLYLASAFGQALALASLHARAPKRARPTLAPAASHALESEAAALPAEVTREARTMGRAMLVGSLGYSACSRIQPFAIGQLHGLTAVASFAGALTLLGPLRLLSAAVDVVLRPRLARLRSDPQASLRLLRGALLGQLAAGLGTCALLGVAGEVLAALVFGPALEGVASLVVVGGAYVTAEALGSSLVVGLQTLSGAEGANQATRVRVSLSLASLALVVPACAFAGALGALVALLACELVFVIATASKVAWSHPSSLRHEPGSATRLECP